MYMCAIFKDKQNYEKFFCFGESLKKKTINIQQTKQQLMKYVTITYR